MSSQTAALLDSSKLNSSKLRFTSSSNLSNPSSVKSDNSLSKPSTKSNNTSLQNLDEQDDEVGETFRYEHSIVSLPSNRFGARFSKPIDNKRRTSVLEPDSYDHYLKSQMENKRSVLGQIYSNGGAVEEIQSSLTTPFNLQKQENFNTPKYNIDSPLNHKNPNQLQSANETAQQKLQIGLRSFSFAIQQNNKSFADDCETNIQIISLVQSKTDARSNFSEHQRLLVAIATDDVSAFQQVKMTSDEIVNLRFEEGMNVLNLAIDQVRIQIVLYLALTLTPAQKQLLAEHEYLGIKAVHQAVSLGNAKLLKCVVEDFKGNLNDRAQQDITVLHFAAQNYTGYLSLLVIKDELSKKVNYNFDVNQRSGLMATPLHFAVIFREIKNVELLIKFEADIDAQDREGRTPLHIAVMRLCSQMSENSEVTSKQSGSDWESDIQQQIYIEYKLIMKELIFHGADRKIKNNQGLTPFMIMEQHKDLLQEEQVNSLRIILTEQRTCMCLMKHRPLKKVKRSPFILLLGVIINLTIAFLFYYGEKEFIQDATIAIFLHIILKWSSVVCFGILVPSFMLAAVMDPGKLEKNYDFVLLVSEFIDCEKDLMNLCTYCQLIKSETSFHCLFCGSCVELFDHHCPFLNSCLGYRNYKYFLVFIVSYFTFLCVLAAEVIRIQIQNYIKDGYQYKAQSMTIVIFILGGLCFPVISYQLLAQIRSLCKQKPTSLVTIEINNTRLSMMQTFDEGNISATHRPSSQSLSRISRKNSLFSLSSPQAKKSLSRSLTQKIQKKGCICCSNLARVWCHKMQTQKELRDMILGNEQK